MNKYLKPNLLPVLTLGLGGIGLALCSWLYGAGTDAKGLLDSGHIANYLLWPVCIAAPLLLFWQTRQIRSRGRYGDRFPADRVGAVGYWIGAVGILVTGFADLMKQPDLLGVLSGVLGLLCFPALLLGGWYRLNGSRPSFVIHVVPCLHFTLRLLCQYRLWSADPQLQDYCFQLLAGMGLMLFSYHRAAFDVNMGKYRFYVLTGLLTVFFCCVALPTSTEKLFFSASGIWVATNLGNLSFRENRVEILPQEEK